MVDEEDSTAVEHERNANNFFLCALPSRTHSAAAVAIENQRRVKKRSEF
jgi:hypothetical protein